MVYSLAQKCSDEYWLDESLRGATIGYIIEKRKGRRIWADTGMCTNAYIHQGNPADYKTTPITNVEDYKQQALQTAGLIMQAKTAEKVKAEMMQLGGLEGEVEVVFSKHEFLTYLPPSEQVELAQWALDISIQEVKKHFDGMIWVASATNFDSGHQDFPATGLNESFGPHWKDISYAGADHVSFTLSTSCDFAHLERYLDIQFDAIMEIVQRDNVTWGIFPEISKRKYGPTFNEGCKDEFDDREVEMWELLHSKLDTLPIQPYFLSIPPPPRSLTIDDEGYSPTETDATKGDWQLFSLDVSEILAEVQEVLMEYTREHVRE